MMSSSDPQLQLGATGSTISIVTTSLRQVPLCPDGLRFEDLGEADNARGRVVRAFFWVMRWWR
jgi:hypothetical protein